MTAGPTGGRSVGVGVGVGAGAWAGVGVGVTTTVAAVVVVPPLGLHAARTASEAQAIQLRRFADIKSSVRCWRSGLGHKDGGNLRIGARPFQFANSRCAGRSTQWNSHIELTSTRAR